MKLYEFETKQLLAKSGVPIPQGKLFHSHQEIDSPGVVKAQVLAGKRGKAGFIKMCGSAHEAQNAAREILGKKHGDETVAGVLVEGATPGTEYYLSFTFDQRLRDPVMLLSVQGGVDVESADRSLFQAIHIEGKLDGFRVRETAKRAGFSSQVLPKLSNFALRVYDCFHSNDFRLLEINPLTETEDGSLVAVGAAGIIDDDGLQRHPEIKEFGPRNAGREPTQRELEAKKIDENDYRGTAGKYLELDGDVAMLTPGGGGSITNMDALIAAGGNPANYCEYSGNPPTEKVYKLAKIVLSKPGLNACWHVGGISSMTRVDETMRGFVQAIEEMKPHFPIVIRRGGPGEEEAFRLLKECAKRNDLNLHLFGSDTPMTETASLVVKLANEYSARE
ncbi:hypothetical protein HYS54_05245 [Candidatus Micrarchaeota archaeon]|nr:hypothetical protein [Candidatus Micrarchaeota archaeon]